MVDEFLRYIQYEKKYSSHTVSAYTKDISQFCEFLQAEYSITDITEAQPDFLRDWVASMREAGIEARSINRKLSAIRSLYKYMKKRGNATSNLISKISALKMPKQLPKSIKSSEMEQLLDDGTPSGGFIEVRNDLILELLYDTGIRRAELISIKDSDFNFFSLTLRIVGKGNKERIVPISTFLKEKVERYITIRNQEIGPCENLIVTEKGEPAYPKLVYRIVHDELSKVSTAEKRSPHVLRHSFASDMLNSGADINTVKSILGHASLAATQMYTHSTFKQMQETYRKAHPRK